LPYCCRLNIISERVSSACVISEVPWSSAARWQRRYSSSEQAGVQSGAVTIWIRSCRPCQSADSVSNVAITSSTGQAYPIGDARTSAARSAGSRARNVSSAWWA